MTGTIGDKRKIKKHQHQHHYPFAYEIQHIMPNKILETKRNGGKKKKKGFALTKQ